MLRVAVRHVCHPRRPPVRVRNHHYELCGRRLSCERTGTHGVTRFNFNEFEALMVSYMCVVARAADVRVAALSRSAVCLMID